MSISHSIKLGAALLAGSMLFAAERAEAQCTTAAWTTTVGSPATGGPATGTIKRYSGACGLAPATATASYVVESASHVAEGGGTPFRGRFYIYTGVSAGTPVVFRAFSDDPSTASVFDVTYDAAEQNFDFSVNGTTRSTAAGTAPRDRWVAVNFVYQANQAFTASTRTGATTATVDSTGFTAGAATIQAVQLGNVVPNGATGTLYFDEYEASRASSGTGAFTMVCRGDTNMSGQYDLADIFGVVDEFLRTQGDSSRSFAAGQPDFDENGQVALDDIFGVVDSFLAVQAGTPGAGCSN